VSKHAPIHRSLSHVPLSKRKPQYDKLHALVSYRPATQAPCELTHIYRNTTSINCDTAQYVVSTCSSALNLQWYLVRCAASSRLRPCSSHLQAVFIPCTRQSSTPAADTCSATERVATDVGKSTTVITRTLQRGRAIAQHMRGHIDTPPASHAAVIGVHMRHHCTPTAGERKFAATV
jgi:hypothetical protein